MNKPPETKTTTELEAPPAWAIEMTQRMVDRFDRIDASLGVTNGEVQTLATRVGGLEGRMTGLEGRMTAVEGRQNATSERVKQTSEADLGHDAAIGNLVAEVGELKKKTDASLLLLNELKAVAANPMVRKVGYALASVVLLYLGAVATQLQAKSAAPVPAGYVLVPVDAGAP